MIQPPAPTPGALCREYYAFFSQPESKSAWAGELALWQKLDGLAGGPWKVFSFCLPYVDYGSWAGKGPKVTPPHGNNPWPSGNQGNSNQGNPGNSAGGQAGNPGGPGSNGSENTPASGATSAATSNSGSGSGPGQPGHAHLGAPGSQGAASRIAQ